MKKLFASGLAFLEALFWTFCAPEAVLHRIPDIMPFAEPEYDLENISEYFRRNENVDEMKEYKRTRTLYKFILYWKFY